MRGIIRRGLIVLLSLVFLTGCGVGLTGGNISGREHGYVASLKLAEGMSIQEVEAILSEGGALYPPAIFLRSGEGSFVPDDPDQIGKVDPALTEMKKLPDADRKRIQRIIIQSRGSGFFGFDTYYLYFDANEKLVDHALLHFN